MKRSAFTDMGDIYELTRDSLINLLPRYFILECRHCFENFTMKNFETKRIGLEEMENLVRN